MYAASIERHRQGATFRVRLHDGKASRNLYARGKATARPLTLATFDALIARMGAVEVIMPDGTRRTARKEWRDTFAS